jgi:hypothetical protein
MRAVKKHTDSEWILLDELDKELERRGRKFCRHADDCNIYERSRQAGERVMAPVREFLGKRLRLKVNREKSAVARPWERKFLGYSMTWHKQPRLKVAESSIERLKANADWRNYGPGKAPAMDRARGGMPGHHI